MNDNLWTNDDGGPVFFCPISKLEQITPLFYESLGDVGYAKFVDSEKIFVFYEESGPFTWLPSSNQDCVGAVVRWIYAEENTEVSLVEILACAKLPLAEPLEFVNFESTWLLGNLPNGDFIKVENLPSGEYKLESFLHNPDEDTSFIVHLLRKT